MAIHRMTDAITGLEHPLLQFSRQELALTGREQHAGELAQLDILGVGLIRT